MGRLHSYDGYVFFVELILVEITVENFYPNRGYLSDSK